MTMMMMIMIAGLVDSITTPIKSWLDSVGIGDDNNMRVKEVGAGVDSCIVCLSEVGLGERHAMLERCGHGFHVECVEAWLKDHPKCPLCRTPISACGDDKADRGGYLKKYLYEMMMSSCSCVMETLATWLTAPFSLQGLQSSLSESCSYL